MSLLTFIFVKVFTHRLFARAIGAICRGGADSPTALGKGANDRKVDLPLFLMLSRP